MVNRVIALDDKRGHGDQFVLDSIKHIITSKKKKDKNKNYDDNETNNNNDYLIASRLNL